MRLIFTSRMYTRLIQKNSTMKKQKWKNIKEHTPWRYKVIHTTLLDRISSIYQIVADNNNTAFTACFIGDK